MFRLEIELGRSGRKIGDPPVEKLEALSFIVDREQAHKELDRLLEAMEVSPHHGH